MRIGECHSVKDLIEACETARQRRIERRRSFETLWWNNIALVAGDHYASWNPNVASFEDRDPNWVDTGDKKPRIVLNHALTVARTELAKLTKSNPIMEIIANSDEATDIAATKVGRAGLDFAEWKFRLKSKRAQAIWWTIVTGMGSIYVGWDYLNEEAGEFRFPIDPTTGEPTFSPQRRAELTRMAAKGEIGELEEETFPLGELEYRVYSPFQLLPDEVALNFEDLNDLITTDVVDVDTVTGLYGKKGLKPESDATLGAVEARMIQRMGNLTNLSQFRNVENGINIHSFWLKPGVYRGNKFLQNGVFLRWCRKKEKLEFSNTFPFVDGRIPHVFFQHIPSNTSIWPDSVITHVRGPNLELDKTVSQLIENKDYMANPAWRVATQHRIKGEVKNVAGAIIRYRHVPNVPPPEPVPGMQMPTQVENLLVGLRSQILDISGQSEVARGRVPTGVRSGVAVAYLQEEDDTKLGPTVHNIEETIALMGSMTLERYSQFYTTERILRFYRRDGVFDVVRFKGADLKNNTDVVCQAGSAMPRSKAARQQYTLELVGMGLMKDPRRILEELDLGHGEPDLRDKNIALANRENYLMLFGAARGQAQIEDTGDEEADMQRRAAAVPVRDWHDHEAHIERHTTVMMDEEFQRLEIASPEIVRLFDEHVAMHQQALAKQQMQQMQMVMATRGAPDGRPAGQQPTEQVGPNGNKPTAAGEPVENQPTPTPSAPEGVM